MGLHAGYWLLALAAIWALQAWLAVSAAWRPIPYSDFLNLLHEHKVDTVRGMDICMVRVNQLCRDEAYMETSVLQELMARVQPAIA